MPGQFKTTLISLTLLLALTLGPQAALKAQAGSPETADGNAAKTETAGPASTTAIAEAELKEAKGRTAHLETPKVYKGEKMSIDVQNEEVPNILKMIGEFSGKTIVVPETVSGQVTLKLKDVPWDQALDIVLCARGLSVEESGDILTVYKLSPHHCGSGRNRQLAAEKVAAMQLTPLAKKVFTPKYASIGQVATELNKFKTERGKIVSIGKDIYVEDKPETIEAMSKAFKGLDQAAPRILIEARVVEADAAFMESLGAKWKGGDAELGR